VSCFSHRRGRAAASFPGRRLRENIWWGAGEIFFDLFVLAVLGDDFGELGVLLGDLLEARRVGDEFLCGELIGQVVIAVPS